MIRFIDNDELNNKISRYKDLVQKYGERLLSNPEQTLFEEYLEAKTKLDCLIDFSKIKDDEAKKEAILCGCEKLGENYLSGAYRRGLKDAITDIVDCWSISKIIIELSKDK